MIQLKGSFRVFSQILATSTFVFKKECLIAIQGKKFIYHSKTTFRFKSLAKRCNSLFFKAQITRIKNRLKSNRNERLSKAANL